MGRKAKYTTDQIIKVCEEYLSGAKSPKELAREYSMKKNGRRIILTWVKKYQALGPDAFIRSNHNSTYSREFKLMVVQEYMNGSISYEHLTNKYNIRSESTVISWVSKYNDFKELKDYIPAPEVYTMKLKKSTMEERIEIATWCINNNSNYKETASKFNCSYTQVYNWVKKYTLEGAEGLSDKRGHRKQQESLTSEELLSRENAKLSKRNTELEREIELLKKLNAFVWKD